VLTRAIDVAGADADLLLNRGIAHAACANTAAALTDFDSALALPDADAPELLFHRGCCLIAAGEQARAAADLRECRRLGGRGDEVEALLADA
jgi:Flp pilus assembly protein TadD